LKYKQCPYVRACGALYVRFLSHPEELWDRMSPWLLDDQLFKHSADKSRDSITFGTFCELLLAEKNFFNIVLPRTPVILDREIKAKLV
jgi:pre-mRNA-splicing factor 38B